MTGGILIMQGHSSVCFNLNCLLQADGGVNACNFLLSDANIRLRHLDGTVIEDFVEEDKAFGTMIVGIVDIAAKGFAESMRGEVLDFKTVLKFELLELHVDILQCQRFISFWRRHDIVLFVRTAQCLPEFIKALLNRWVEGNLTCLTCLLFHNSD